MQVMNYYPVEERPLTRGGPRACDLDCERAPGESRRGPRSLSFIGHDLLSETQGTLYNAGIPLRPIDDVHGFNPPTNVSPQRGRGSLESDIFGRGLNSRSKTEFMDDIPSRASLHQFPSVKTLRSRNAPRASRNGRLPPGGELSPIDMQTSSRAGSLVSRDANSDPFRTANRTISQRPQVHAEGGLCQGEHCNTLSFPEGLHAFEDDAMKYDPVVHELHQHPFGNHQELLTLWRRGVLQGGLAGGEGGGPLRIPPSLLPLTAFKNPSDQPTAELIVRPASNLTPLPALHTTTSGIARSSSPTEGTSVPVCRDCFRVYMFREAQRLQASQHGLPPAHHLIHNKQKLSGGADDVSSPRVLPESPLKGGSNPLDPLEGIPLPSSSSHPTITLTTAAASLAPLQHPAIAAQTPEADTQDEDCAEETASSCRQVYIQDPSENASRELLCSR